MSNSCKFYKFGGRCVSNESGSCGYINNEDECVEMVRITHNETKEENNGGSTDYYKFKPEWKDCQDIIEDRKMTFAQGNIFKAAFCFNIQRHDGSTPERELNKIIWFAKRLLDEL